MTEPKKDLLALKRRVAAKQTVPMRTLTGEMVREALDELDALKQFIRDTYQGSISTEDGGEFTLGVQEDFQAKIKSWGETPMTPEEYMDAQREAQERAANEKEFERLKKVLGK